MGPETPRARRAISAVTTLMFRTSETYRVIMQEVCPFWARQRSRFIPRLLGEARTFEGGTS